MVTEQKQAAEDGPYVYLDPFLIRRRQINVAVHCAKSGGDMKVGEVVDFRDGKDSIT